MSNKNPKSARLSSIARTLSSNISHSNRPDFSNKEIECIDASNLSEGWKKLLELSDYSLLLFALMHDSFERTYSFARRHERTFLLTVKGIADKPELLRQKMSEIAKEIATINSLPPL